MYGRHYTLNIKYNFIYKNAINRTIIYNNNDIMNVHGDIIYLHALFISEVIEERFLYEKDIFF